MTEKFRDWKTVDIAKFLTKQSEEDVSSEDIYYGVKELSRRQTTRIKFKLNETQRQDLCHDVATNIYVFLQLVSPPKSNFVVSNWIKYVYNKTYKTCLSMYPMGNERTQIFDIDDVVTNREFLSIYFREQIQQYRDIMNSEFQVSLHEFKPILKKLIEDLCRYKTDCPPGSTIITSVLLSIIKGREIILFGLEPLEREYVSILRNLVIVNLPAAFKASVLNYNPLLDLYLANVTEYNLSETYGDQDE